MESSSCDSPLHTSTSGKNEAVKRVHEALRSCAVAENSSHARQILNDLFVFNDLEDMEMIRYLMIELCVSVFHGLTPPEPPRPAAIPAPPFQNRQSKLGTINLPPLSSVADSEATDPFVYDEYSDGSNDDNYSSYSNEKDSSEKNQSTAEEQWAQALNHDNQPHSPEQQVTCEDLFNALATNLSSVVLPKVPIIHSTNSSTSSSTPSVVSTSPSVPSHIPHSINSNQSPSQSFHSSPRSSPTDSAEIYHHLDFDDRQDTLQSLSNNGDEEDDLRSVDTIEAAHDQFRRSQQSANSETTTPSTPPTVRPTRFHDHGKTKAKSSRKILRIRGPTRLRNLIENAVNAVIQECEFENSSTPQKHTSHGKKLSPSGTPLRLTNPILKRITRSVSIELSLELSANIFTASDHLNYPSPSLERPQQTAASPAARDLSSLLWPAISGFVGTEVTPEMVGVFVDLIEADVIDKKIFPDLYINQHEDSPQRGQGGLILFMEEEEEEEANGVGSDDEEGRIPAGAQDVIISQYVNDIDRSQGSDQRTEEDPHRTKRTPTGGGHRKRNQSSASRQILDLDGDFDEEPSDYSRKDFEIEKSTPKKEEIPAWDTAVSPMDHLFRQTVGALGSTRKLPYLPDDDDDDGGDGGDASVDFLYQDQQQQIYRGLHDSDYDSETEQPPLHEDTEFVDSYQAAEEEILGIRNRRTSSSPSPSSSSAGDSTSNVDGSDVPDSSLQPQLDPEDSFVDGDDGDADADEDYISISDLPPDFGETKILSHHELNGVYHSEPALSEEDLDALERQLSQSTSSASSSQVFSNCQPSIAEIIVGEDNLIVLPHGETPVSSPDLRFIGNSNGIQKSERYDSEGSPKYRNHISSTSSDSSEESEGAEGDSSDRDRDSADDVEEGDDEDKYDGNQDEDSLENDQQHLHRRRYPSSSPPQQLGLAENIQIDTLLSEDTEELIGNKQNWMYYPATGSQNPHIPPSPFIDEGFKNQIPFPKSMNGLSPSSTIDFQAISAGSNGDMGLEEGQEEDEEEGEEELGEEEYGEEIEPRQLDQSFMIPSPQRHLQQTAPTDPPLKSLSSSSSSSSSEGEHNVDTATAVSGGRASKKSSTTMTSDDEREEDRRLFDAIMNDKPVTATATRPRAVADIVPGHSSSGASEFPPPTEEEMQEYFAEMMRNALHGIDHFIVGPPQTSSDSSTSSSAHHPPRPPPVIPPASDLSETQLQEISAQAIENMDQRFQSLFSKHLPKDFKLTSTATTATASSTGTITATAAERRIVEMEEKAVDYHSKKIKTMKKNHSKSTASDASHRQKSHHELMDETGAEVVLTPEEYLHHSTIPLSSSRGSYPDPAEYQKRLSQILGTPSTTATGGAGAGKSSRGRGGMATSQQQSLPITGNEKLNQMFTQSFRELVSYYQANGAPGAPEDHLPPPPPPPLASVVAEENSKARNTPKSAEGGGIVRSSETSSKGKKTKVKVTQERSKRRSVHESELDLGEEHAQQQGQGQGWEKQGHGSKERGAEQMTRVKAKKEKVIAESDRGTGTGRGRGSSSVGVGMVQGRLYHEDITAATDYSKHLHGNHLTSGRVVYGLHNEGPIMSQEWNTTNNRPTRRKPRSLSPSSAPSSPPSHRRQLSNSSTKSSLASSPVKREKPSRRPSSAPRHGRKSSTGGTMASSSSSSSSSSRFQHLSAPTFSSVVRSLNIAGIDYNEVQAITQASKDANFLISSHHADLSSPSYVDSYYTSGIDIITALAATHQTAGTTSGKKKKRQGGR